MVVDLDGDGAADIVVAAYESMIAVDGTGRELWRYDTPGRYHTCPAILERRGETPLIYAGKNTGMFTCLDGRGKAVWQRQLAPVSSSSPALADLNGDGTVELIQGDRSGKVNVFDALTGDTVWVKQLDGEDAGSPAVGDLNGDGKAEIVIRSTVAGKIFALDASGNVIWSFDVGKTNPDWKSCAPIMFRNSHGQACVVVGSTSATTSESIEQFYCLDGAGNVLWQRPTRGAVVSTIAAGDLDADGRADIFAVTLLGVLYRFDEDGRVLWEIDTQGRSNAPGTIVDVDGDGALEYMICSQAGNLLVFKNSGEIVFNHQFDNRTLWMTPAFGDIVKSRPGLEFAVTGGESGRLFCFGSSAPVDAPPQWGTWGGDNRLTGAWFGLGDSKAIRMVPENLNWDQLLVGEDVSFRIGRPDDDSTLTAEAVCTRPDGSRQAAVGKVIGKHGLLKMPFSLSAPGVYHFEWTLKGPFGDALSAGSRDLTLQPYVNDRALAQRAVSALRDAIGETGVERNDRSIRATMHQESLGIESEAVVLASLQAAVPGAAPAFVERVNARTAALNVRAKRAFVLADISKSLPAKASDSRIFAFQGLTWENRDVNRQLPSEVAVPLQIERRCVRGEHEPVSIKLLNVSLDTVTTSCRVETDAGGPLVTPYEVKPVPTNRNTIAWDPIVPIGPAGVAIPSLEAREVWLDINLADATPGQHCVSVSFAGSTPDAAVEISLDVIPFEMAGYGSMRLIVWANYRLGNTVQDMLAHGATVFITSVGATVEEGTPTRINVDFERLDKFIVPLLGHNVFLLLSGVPRLGVPTEDSAYVPRLANYLGQVFDHLAARGIDENHVALYPYDEPGGNGWRAVENYVTFGEQVQKARPGTKIYVDGGGDLPMFEKMAPVTSIWCPSYYMLPDHTPEMNLVRATGKTLWSYNCANAYGRPIGWHTKTINVAGEHRMAGVFAFNYGATGIGYWCYNLGKSMWGVTDDEFSLVYTDSTGFNTSCRRWEAVREGVEDARILIALREKLSDPSVSAAAKAKIRHLLEVTLPDMANQSIEEARTGASRYVLDATNNDESVATFRRELLDCAAAASR